MKRMFFALSLLGAPFLAFSDPHPNPHPHQCQNGKEIEMKSQQVIRLAQDMERDNNHNQKCHKELSQLANDTHKLEMETTHDLSCMQLKDLFLSHISRDFQQVEKDCRGQGGDMGQDLKELSKLLGELKHELESHH
jgi:hypothetical protein